MNIQNAISAFAQALLDQNQSLAFDFQSSVGDFVVVSFEALEAINAPFEITIELASFDDRIDLHALMDTEARLGIHDRYQGSRFLHGVITRISRGVSGMHRTFYFVTLRPSLWRLTQTSDSRIWQQKSVPEIAQDVLEMHHVPNVEWRLHESYAPREFLTQREERHLPFLERILAEEGIFYFFEHVEDAHKLIFTDAPLITPSLQSAPSLTYNATKGGTQQGAYVSRFVLNEELRSSSYELSDYTFKNPPANMKQAKGAQEINGLANDYALYDYPARYKDPANVGKKFVKNRIEAERVDATTGTGETNSVHLSAGFRFELTDHDFAPANGAQFLLSVNHAGQQPAALEEEAGSEPTTYAASFTTMPARLPYRPAIRPKPVVDGPEIAIVTEPKGEEIYTDDFGRVTVKFYWDRHGKQDETSSCWIRVAHASAGMRYGHATIPRIGHEVIISYLGGDIDQPIVTGPTYNPTQKHTYDLPANKTRSYWKDKTHKGDGFNEIRFESEKGKEEIFVHAERDMNLYTTHHRSEQTDNNYAIRTGRRKFESIGRGSRLEVNGGYEVIVGGKIESPRFWNDFSDKNKIGLMGYQLDDRIMTDDEPMAGYRLNSNSGIIMSSGADTNITSNANTSFVSSGSMLLTAGKNLNLSASQSFFLKAGELLKMIFKSFYASNSKARIKIDEHGHIEITTLGNISLKGANVDIKADSEITLQASKIKMN